MGVIEYGKCEVCGKEKPLIRTYFHYDFKCQCHSPNHFEFVRHCADCKPQKPTETKVLLSNEQAENLVPVKCGHWIEIGTISVGCGDNAYLSSCSACGAEVVLCDYDNYCPACGAEMGGDY